MFRSKLDCSVKRVLFVTFELMLNDSNIEWRKKKIETFSNFRHFQWYASTRTVTVFRSHEQRWEQTMDWKEVKLRKEEKRKQNSTNEKWNKLKALVSASERYILVLLVASWLVRIFRWMWSPLGQTFIQIYISFLFISFIFFSFHSDKLDLPSHAFCAFASVRDDVYFILTWSSKVVGCVGW